MARTFTQRRTLALALAVLASGCATVPELPPSSKSSLLGKKAPTFHRQTVSGEPFVSEALVGKVVVYEFFAKWCVPCQRRLPIAQQVSEEFPEAQFVGISLDEKPQAAAHQIARYRLRFPVIHDVGLSLSGRFRVRELPAAMVVGRDGKVLWFGGPEQEDEDLRQAVHAALHLRTAAPKN